MFLICLAKPAPLALFFFLLAVATGACGSAPTAPTGPAVTHPPEATPIPTGTPAPTPPATSTPSPTGSGTRQPPAPTATPAPPPLSDVAVALEVAFPNLSFNRMTFMTPARDGTDRLFLALQEGRIMVFPNRPDVATAQVFLDIRDRVDDRGNEEGLLGLALDPDFAANGFFYVYYTGSGPKRSVISRFSVRRDDPDRADPGSESVILEVPQPFANHNGGHLLFGEDGYLYIGLGDGGSAGDPRGNGQNPATLLGSILRIDPRQPAGDLPYSVPPDNPFVGQPGFREEIWAYGFRNPWRFSAQPGTGRLWVGDVGQNSFEEVDLALPGRNYGWNLREGFHCFPSRVNCPQEGLEPPVVEYPLAGGNCAVTGGYQYRGSRAPDLRGAYIYADFCSGRVWGLRHDGRQVTDQALLLDSDLSIPSFAEDREGELYLLSFDGRIYRLR